MPRNFTSDGTTGRTHLNTAETDTISSLPGIQRVWGYNNPSKNVIKIPKSKEMFFLVYPN